MRRGVEFYAHDSDRTILCDVLSGIEIENYNWFVQDLWLVDEIEESMLREGSYTGTEFIQAIRTPHWIFSGVVCRFPKGETGHVLTDYNSYMESNSSFALICVDCYYIEAYCKAESDIDKLLEDCKKMGYENIHVKTDKSDGRTSFRV